MPLGTHGNRPWIRGCIRQWEGADAWRIVLAALIPGAPFLLARLLLHQHSGIWNVDYLILTLLSCAGWVRLASVLFVVTYALEFLRLLDAVYLFSQQDLTYVAHYICDVPVWLVVVWLLAFAVACGIALKLWHVLVPAQGGPREWRAALLLGAVFIIFLGVDVAQGFNPLLRTPHGKARQHLVGEVLVRMPVQMIHAASQPEQAVALTTSATQPLWGDSVIGRKRENVVVVVVESMGLLEDEEARGKEFAAFDDPAIRQSYTVREGSVPFQGATVSGEMRELCHLGTHVRVTGEMLAGQQPCLPEQYADRGYETTAYNGYREAMFQRGNWYRKIGFRETDFLGELGALPKCNGAFYGVCDDAVVDALEQRLAAKTAAGAPPQFLYWMTLNGHLPVDAGDAPAQACPVKADHEVCAQLAYTEEVLQAVRRLALAEKGRTAIVVVGDHAPPYISVDRRDLFDDARVPFVALMPRG